MAYLGIDLGGTYARAAAVEHDGRILSSAKIALTDRSPEAVVESIASAVRDALAGGITAEACGVGVAGMLDRDSGMVAVAPNLGWRNVPFGALLSARLQRTVRVVNDLSAAAWGELKAGAGRSVRDILVVFVGSGVGSAIVSSGRLVHGATGAAGEFGHVKVVPEGRLCGCGQRGCLEAYAGGHNLIAQMKEAAAGDRPTSLSTALVLNPAVLETAALAGDAVATEIYERATGFLAVSIANQVTVLNPAKLILGGGVLTRCAGMRSAVAAGVMRFATGVSTRSLQIVDAELGDDSGLIGAALLSCED